MAYQLFKALFDGIGSAAWGGGRSFYDGISGRSRFNGISGQWRNKNGEIVKMNPARKTARRLKANAKQAITGNVYNPHNMELAQEAGSIGKRIENMVGGAAGVVASPLTGMVSMAGWGTRTAAGGALLAAKYPTRALGHLTYQGFDFATTTAVGAAKTIHKMSNDPVGKNVLFFGAAGAMTLGGVAEGVMGKSGLSQEKLALYAGQQIDSVPGTLASQGAAQGSNVMVDTGADGELALALHTLR